MPRRPSISGVFPGQDLVLKSTSSSSKAQSPTRSKGLMGSLRGNMGSVWPVWSKGNSRNLTIRLDSVYRTIAAMDDPSTQFSQTQMILQEMQRMNDLASNEDFRQALENSMFEVVFGSNYIERVGTSYNITLGICQKIFRGLPVDSVVSERDPEYQAGLEALGFAATQGPASRQVIRARSEVIQHARALDHIVSKMVVEGEGLTEVLIKDTHQILCTGHDSADGIPSEEYAGKYRKERIWANSTGVGKKHIHEFIHPKSVSHFMKDMCAAYQEDVREAEASKSLDPFTLAAKYCHLFVNIHPFIDGNGRMCRLILNAILLKYAGMMIPIGENGDAGRDEYLQATVRGSKEFLADNYEEPSPDGHRLLGSLVIRKAAKRIQEVFGRMGKGS